MEYQIHFFFLMKQYGGAIHVTSNSHVFALFYYLLCVGLWLETFDRGGVKTKLLTFQVGVCVSVPAIFMKYAWQFSKIRALQIHS